MTLDLKCIKLITLGLFIHTLIQVTNGDVVILNVRKEQTEESLNLCVLKKEVTANDENRRYKLVNFDTYTNKYDGCSAYSGSLSSSMPYLRIGTPFQCSLATVVSNLQAKSPSIVLIGSDGPLNVNSSASNLNVSYLFMPDSFADQLTKFLGQTTNVTASISTDTDKLDFSLILIWFIALFAILTGALWTRYEFRLSLSSNRIDLLNKEAVKTSKQQDQVIENHNNILSSTVTLTQNDDSPNKSSKLFKKSSKLEQANSSNRGDDLDNKNLTTISVGYVAIFILLIFVVSMLLLLYFFYNIMIYFIYVIFGLGATTAFYRIGSLLFDNINILACEIPKNNIPVLKNHTIEIRRIVLFLCSIAVSVCWFVFRHQTWSWIMQNIMALSLAINALSYYRLGTYKTVTILLSVFFVYDIFMVFVTPQFTKGTSIMEAVAFGGKDASETASGTDWGNLQFSDNRVDYSNRLPVVIVVPHLLPNKRLCDYYYDYPFSLLGLGDILIPGLSVNYAIIFDVSNSNRIPVYFIVNVFAYLVGLIFAFVGLILMNTAQPALLYLCPFLIITSIGTSLIRKEFKIYWNGDPIKKITLESETLNEREILANKKLTTTDIESAEDDEEQKS